MLHPSVFMTAALPVYSAELLVLGVMLFSAGVVLPVMAFWRRGKRSGDGDLARCGHCGYAVTGLTTFTCPECGSDLREVGIVRRGGGGRFARAGSPVVTFLRLVGWQLALFAAVFA